MVLVSDHLDLSLILNIILGRCIDPDKQIDKQASKRNKQEIYQQESKETKTVFESYLGMVDLS